MTLVYIIVAVLVALRFLAAPARRRASALPQQAPRALTVNDIPDEVAADDPRKAEYLRLLKIPVKQIRK